MISHRQPHSARMSEVRPVVWAVIRRCGVPDQMGPPNRPKALHSPRQKDMIGGQNAVFPSGRVCVEVAC